MIRHYRVLAATVLALSLTGCAGLPSLGLLSAPAAKVEDSASVRVTVGAGYQTQAFSNIALTLRLELPWAQDPSKRVQVLNVQAGVPFEFKNLPTGYGTLTAIATDTTNNTVVDRQSQPVQLRPGYQAQASFNLVVGGSSALDLAVWADPERINVRYQQFGDGLDAEFMNPVPFNGPITFTWSDATQSVPVTFNLEYYPGGGSGLVRQIGDGPKEGFGGEDVWYWVPKHAALVDHDPLGNFNVVRHFRWDNSYMIGGSWKALIIDRWLSPYDGLLKETVSEPGVNGPTLVSTLERQGLYPGMGGM